MPNFLVAAALPLLHEDLTIVFPEARVVRLFFDERHTVKMVKVDFTSADSAHVKVVVN